VFDYRQPLPLPPMVFRDVQFEVVHIDEEVCLRADQIGQALLIEPPEPGILELYQAHRTRFSDFISRVVVVTVDGQARPMRVFTLWGTLTLARHATTSEAPAFEAWTLELLMIRGYSLHFEIVRLHHENSDLYAKLYDLEANVRVATMELEKLGSERRERQSAEPPALDADFRRLFEERTGLLPGLAEDVKALRASLAQGPDPRYVDGQFQRLIEHAGTLLQDLPLELADLLAGAAGLSDPATLALNRELPSLVRSVTRLNARLEALTPARRDLAEASRASGKLIAASAPAVPDLQFLRFDHPGDDLSVWGALVAGDPTPWLSAADLGRLAGLNETRLAGAAAEVERLVPAEHRLSMDEGVLLVDPVGADTLLFHWGDILDDGQAELWGWLAGEVVPALHAAMLRRVQADPETHPGFPGAPTEVVADAPGLFKVWAGELDGHPARLVNTRDLYKQLKAGWKPFAEWFRERDREFAWREGRDYRRVYVRVGQYDPYLSLDAALELLALEKSPAKATAQAYLQRVALGQPATLEGVAVRVEEGNTATASLVPMTYRFEEKQEVRVVMKEGESWWVAKDVAEALEYPASSIKTINKLIAPVPDEWKGRNRIPTLGGEQDLAVLSEQGLYFFLGRSDKPKALPFQKKVAEILTTLRKTGRYEMPGAPSASLPDTPAGQPLVFPYTDAKGHVLDLRVAVRDGRAEAVVFDLGNALGEKEHDFLKWYAAIPARYHGSLPSESGETVLATLGTEGLAYLFGQRAHKPSVDALREFWFGTVEPALAARLAESAATLQARPAAAPAAAEFDPADTGRDATPDGVGASADGFRARCEALAEWLWKHRDGRRSHVRLPNAAALLARLWTLTEGEWLAVGGKTAFARSVGMAHGKSAEQGLGHLCRWGLVEVRPEGAAWPEEIRLDRVAVEAALNEAGLEA
jgi:prophage antirepressor-like protein/phage anti-repressor protein